MGRYEQHRWSGDVGAPSRRDRAGGSFETYQPDLLIDRSVPLTADNATLLSTAESVVAEVSRMEGTTHLSDLTSLLLRTESAASSWLEGIPPKVRQVAFAELALDEPMGGFSDQAQLVARNVHIMRTAVTDLVNVPRLTVADVEGLQRQLVADEREAGIRTGQNWVGGSPYHPLDAAYVPPPPQHVQRLLADLIGYLGEAVVPPLIQAGLAHAQFETIHPFGDGNGRVGRVLIHTVLARRRILRGAVLPISLVLMSRKDAYIRGLEAYRHVGPRDGAEAAHAANAWLSVFLAAVIDAADQAVVIADEVAELMRTWRLRLAEHRRGRNLPPTPRRDSAVNVLLAGLRQAPVMTNTTAQRLFGVSATAASAAFSELDAANITTKRRNRQIVVHVAEDLLQLMDVAQRQLSRPEAQTANPSAQGPPSSSVDLPTSQPLPAEVTESSAWSERALSVWAKTDRDGRGPLSLVRHLTDAGAVGGQLWDHWLPPAVKRVISSGLPEGDLDGRALLTWSAGLHDIGKATPGFAVKASLVPGNEYLVSAMADHGLACPPHLRGGGSLPPHCHLGQFVLSEWLIERYAIGSDAAAALAATVGLHHGAPPNALDLQGFRGSQWTGHRHDAWRQVQTELIEVMSRRTGALDRLSDWVRHPPSEAAQVLLSAAVVVADWLASDTERFPHDDPRPVRDRLEEAGLAEALRSPWRPPPAVANAREHLSHRFPRIARHGIRPLQQQARDVAASLPEPGLLVIEAPMGSGKTEAALLAAEELARTFGAGGVFVALPTMATSDAMFARVLDWARHLDGAEAATMYLAHGKARLNEDYHVLVRRSRVHGINDSEGSADSEDAVVTSWLQGRRKGVLANLVVGTIDQVLFGALKSRHVALRHLALAGKVVVIDEVHAADAYMQRYLSRVLEWLGAYGTPVVLLSATLPTAQLHQLTSAYARGRGVAGQPLPGGLAYPRLTVQTTTLQQIAVPWTDPQSEVDLARLDGDMTSLVEHVATDVEASGCVVVIRNTVRSAQETYLALRERLGPERVSLLHSQFVASDRATKERRLLALLGPDEATVQRPAGHVVVGTQVLEQSLDIDADVMISDHAPVDLILQRMGRLHRHARGEGQGQRPATLRRARMWLVGAPRTDGSPVLDPGGEAVYGAARLLRSAVVLDPHLNGKPIQLPSDIPQLVERAYDPNLASPTAWIEEWETADEDAYIDAQRSRARATTFRVGEPGRSPTLLGWLDARAGEHADDEESLAGQARVRDTEDTLEVLVVWQDRDGIVRVLPGEGTHAGADLGVTQQAPPSDHLALAVLGSSVRLPQRLTRGRRIDRVIRELEMLGRQFQGWQQSHWLQGQLIVCLDDRMRTSLAGESVRYDVELGLLTEGKENQDD